MLGRNPATRAPAESLKAMPERRNDDGQSAATGVRENEVDSPAVAVHVHAP